MKGKLFPIISVAIFFIFAILLLTFGSMENSTLMITLKDSAISSETDSDGDGVPNWLEEISDSNPQNASSFPYQKDIALTKNITIDDLIYGGPGKFTEEITRRVLSNSATPISDSEKEEFISTSVEYFIKRVAKKELPPIHLSINNNVSNKNLAKEYTNAIKIFGKTAIPTDLIVLETFSENNAYFSIARQKRNECAETISSIPKEVPAIIYLEYYAVLERITYLCKALDIAFTSRTPESFFYSIKLLQSGKILNEYSTENDVDEKLPELIIKILDTLNKNA